jgi:hypothetical protein
VCLASVSPAWAEPSEAAILEPADAAVLERVEGQTSDLEWEFQKAAGPPTLRRAMQVGSDPRIDAVIWFAPTSEGGFRVHVLDARARRRLERSVSPPAEEALASSATAELCAYIVRSALQAIGAGREIGQPVPLAKPTAEGKNAAASTPSAKDSSRAAWAEAAAFLVAQVPRRSLEPGLWLGVLFEWSPLAFGVVASSTAKARVELDRATIQLQRQQLGAAVGLRVVDTRAAELWLRLDLGLLAYRRETLVVDVGLSPTPATVTLMPFAAPEVLLSWAPLPARASWLSLLATVAVDVAPGSATLAYEISSQTLDDRSLFRFQPRAMAGIQLRWPIR